MLKLTYVAYLQFVCHSWIGSPDALKSYGGGLVVHIGTAADGESIMSYASLVVKSKNLQINLLHGQHSSASR